MILFRRRLTALVLVAFAGTTGAFALAQPAGAGTPGAPVTTAAGPATTTAGPATTAGTVTTAVRPAGSALAVAELPGTPPRAPAKACSTEEWQVPANFDRCVDALANLSENRLQCLQAPTPSAPDSGMPGWFVSRPEASTGLGPRGLYTKYGYAGFSYSTYDINCVKSAMHPDYKFESTAANGEFMLATGIVGAANALRERAWNPDSMWGWANPLVEKTTKAIYQKVFTVFGSITLAVVGLYLLWRSRQSDMSAAMTTAGWAVLVMVAVTAIAAWPIFSASMADRTLVTSLSVIHDAVGPPTEEVPPGACPSTNPQACVDRRPPAVRASDIADEGLLYRNWLRGTLGSADSETARKYGRVLYDAKSFSWNEMEDIRRDPAHRQAIIDKKAMRWMKVAEQIKSEDPEAYQYLQGTQGMDRIGAGFIAILSAIFFAMFDLTASILVLLGFLIFRWAVIAAPILGTIGLLRPASAGLRRLGNAVVAAIFNIVIFGTGAAVYLYAVTLILGTAALPGWLQVMLIWLTGVVGWLLLRPYRRITQLGGKNATTEVAAAGTWHRRFFRDLRDAATLAVATPDGTPVQAGARRPAPVTAATRPENRADPLDTVAARPPGSGGAPTGTGPEPGPVSTPEASPEPAVREPVAAAPRPRVRWEQNWEEPDVSDEAPMYHVYRPGPRRSEAPARPARRPENAPSTGAAGR